MRNRALPCLLAALAPGLVAAAPPGAAARLADAEIKGAAGDNDGSAAALAEALGLARAAGDEALVARILLRQTDLSVLTDPSLAERQAAEAVTILDRVRGADSYAAAIARTQLAIVRALGGDRARQIDPIASAATAAAKVAATPAEREEAAVALLTAAQFAASGGRAALSTATAARGLALLARPDTHRGGLAAQAYDIAADLAQREGRYADALAFSQSAIEAWGAAGGQSSEASRSLGNAADAMLHLGRYGEAEPLLRRALAIADAARPLAPHLQLLALQKLGDYYRQTGRPALAVGLFDRALRIASAMPKGFRYALGVYRDVIDLHLDRGEPALARPYAARAVEVAAATVGVDTAERASLLLVLADIDLKLGDPDRAAKSWRDAKRIAAWALAPDDPRHGDVLATAGRIAEANGALAEAARDYVGAAAAMTARPPADPDRLAAERAAASALSRLDPHGPEALRHARAAADALTARLIGRSRMNADPVALADADRAVFDTAVAVAWAAAHQPAGAASPAVPID